MPKLACRACGRQIYTTVPLDSLFAEERRCPRCGALLNDERRDAERRLTNRRQNPPDDPGPPEADTRSARNGSPGDNDGVAAARPGDPCPATTLAGSTDPGGAPAVGRVRVAFLGFGLIAGSIARALRLADGRAWELVAWSPSGAGAAKALADGVLDRVAASGPDAMDGAELVVLAAPASDCLALLDAIAGPWKGSLVAGAVVTDVASTKGRAGRPCRDPPTCATWAATRWRAAMRPATAPRPRTCSRAVPGSWSRARTPRRPMSPSSRRWRPPAAPARS